MNEWAWMGLAVATQWASIVALRLSDGFRRWSWAAPALGCSVASIGCVSLALAGGLTLAVAYGIWTGAGVALAAGTGALFFDDRLDRVQLLALACVVAGIVALRV